jgi:O-antigen/teichoic acid export membrane protein
VSFKLALDVAMAKQLMRFSAFKVFSVVSGQIVFHLDRFLIAVFLPIASVSYYAVPLNLAQRMLSLVPNITTAVFPAVSGFQDKPEHLRQLYLRCTKSVLIIMLPVTAALVALAGPILSLWMGADFAAQSTPTLRLLAVAFLLASFSAVPCVFAEGLGKPELPALFAAISAVLNLGFALLLIPRFGIAGPALALIANALLQVPVFVDRVNRKLIGVSAWELVKTSYAKPIFAAAVVFVVYLFAAPYVKTLIELGGLILVGSGFYLVLCLSVGALDSTEKEKLKHSWRTILGGFSRNAR